MNELPSGWVLTTLGDVARWGSGGTPRAGDPRFYGGQIPWAVIGDLTDGPVSATAATITEEGLRRSSAKLVPPGSVLVAMYGSIGKLGLTTVTMATNQAIAFAIAHESVVEPRYLMHFLRHQRPRLADAGKGATQRNIGQGTLKAWPIPVPPLEEQRRLVDILEDHLSRLDGASALLARSSRRSTALDTAIAHRALTRVGGVPVPLGDLARSVKNGIFAPRPDAQANGVPILRIGAVRSLMLDLSDLRYSRESEAALRAAGALLTPGDLLFTRYNGNPLYVGACATVPTLAGPLTYPDKLIRVQPRTEIVDPSFLAIACSVGEARTQIQARVKTTAGQAGISGRDLRSVVVRVPSLEAQQSAVADVEAAREEARRLRHSLTAINGRLSQLRRSLLAAAFSGRLTGASSDVDRMEELAGV